MASRSWMESTAFSRQSLQLQIVPLQSSVFKYGGLSVVFGLSDEVLVDFLCVFSGYSCVRAAGCFGPLQTQSEHWHD